MVWHFSLVELSVALERSHKIIRKNCWWNDLLTFLGLRGSLGVVLAHVSVVSGAKTDSTLFTLVTHINTNKHGLVRDFRTKLHTPKVTTKLSVHLSYDVQEDTVVVLGNRSVSNELWNDRTVTINFILDKWVEILMVWVVGHYNQKDELGVLNLTVRILNYRSNLFVIIILNWLSEGFKQNFFVVCCFIWHRTDISEFDLNVQSLLCRKVVELVVDVVSVAYVSF